MLTIFWKAIFKNGSNLEQYDTEGNEKLFKEVLDKQDELSQFVLIDRRNGDVIVVNLIKGFIAKTKLAKEIPVPRADMLRKQTYDYRLIYFREVERSFDNSMREVGTPVIKHHVGFQYTDENNKNHKRVIAITEDGHWVVN